MVNIAKIGTKAMSGLNYSSLSKYANNPKQFDATLKNLKALKMPEAPKADVVNLATKDKLVLDIPKTFAKEPPLWKKIIGKVFG